MNNTTMSSLDCGLLSFSAAGLLWRAEDDWNVPGCKNFPFKFKEYIEIKKNIYF